MGIIDSCMSCFGKGGKTANKTEYTKVQTSDLAMTAINQPSSASDFEGGSRAGSDIEDDGSWSMPAAATRGAQPLTTPAGRAAGTAPGWGTPPTPSPDQSPAVRPTVAPAAVPELPKTPVPVLPPSRPPLLDDVKAAVGGQSTQTQQNAETPKPAEPEQDFFSDMGMTINYQAPTTMIRKVAPPPVAMPPVDPNRYNFDSLLADEASSTSAAGIGGAWAAGGGIDLDLDLDGPPASASVAPSASAAVAGAGASHSPHVRKQPTERKAKTGAKPAKKPKSLVAVAVAEDDNSMDGLSDV